MIDPVSIVARAITSLIIPKAVEKVGERLGEVALQKSEKIIQAIRRAVYTKLEKANSAFLLTRAECSPTEQNTRVLEAEIISQSTDDSSFFDELQTLLDKFSEQSSSCQVLIERLRSDNFEVKELNITSKGNVKSDQFMGRDWEVKVVKIDSISMESHNDTRQNQ